MQQETLHIGNQYFLYDKDLLPSFDADMFNLKALSNSGALRGTAMGRGTAHFFQWQEQQLVLRHYRRGGMIGRFITDSYWWNGLEQTRPWLEWQLLAQLAERNLPVPLPVAARVSHSGVIYRADIITQRITKTQPLAQRLLKTGLSKEEWQAVGATIRRFHEAGADHADLNAHNILLGEKQSVYIIDFDKGYLQAGFGEWAKENLARLKRSLKKLVSQWPEFHFTEAEWHELQVGYGR